MMAMGHQPLQLLVLAVLLNLCIVYQPTEDLPGIIKWKNIGDPKKCSVFWIICPWWIFWWWILEVRENPKGILLINPKKNRHVRKPAPFQVPKFRMPKFRMPKGMPKPIKYPASFAISTKKPIFTKTVKTNFYNPTEKPKRQKLEYSGWQPIGKSHV